MTPLVLILCMIAMPISDYMDEGRRLIDEGDYSEAIRVLEGGLAEHGGSPDIIGLLGTANRLDARRLLARGEPGEAVRRLTSARQLLPGSEEIRRELALSYNALGVSLHAAGDESGAEEAFRTGLGIDDEDLIGSNLAALLLSRGSAEYDEGNLYESTRLLNEALEYDPGLIEAHLLLGRIYYEREIFPLARNHLVSARELSGSVIEGLDGWLERIDAEEEETISYSRVEVDGFIVRFDGSERHDLFQMALPALQEARERVAMLLERRPEHPVTVVIYSDDSMGRATTAPDWAVGLYDGKIRLRAGEILRGSSTVDWVVRHEMTHAVLAEMAPGMMPAWVQEGTARLAEGEEWDPPRDVGFLAGAIADGEWIPLSDLNESFASLPEGTNIRLAYSESAAAMKYIHDNFGRGAFIAFIQAIAAGASVEDALQEATFLDAATFDERVHDWVIWQYGN